MLMRMRMEKGRLGEEKVWFERSGKGFEQDWEGRGRGRRRAGVLRSEDVRGGHGSDPKPRQQAVVCDLRL